MLSPCPVNHIRNHLPAKVEAKTRKEANIAAQSETCPQKGPGTYFASLFQSPFLFSGDSFSFVNKNPLHIHNREGWNYCGFSFETFFVSPVHSIHASVWIFSDKSPRAGSLLLFVRWLGSNTHTWKVSGVLSWCLLAWGHGDMQGHSQHQAGWLQSTVPLQITLCLEAHPVELEKKPH